MRTDRPHVCAQVLAGHQGNETRQLSVRPSTASGCAPAIPRSLPPYPRLFRMPWLALVPASRRSESIPSSSTLESSPSSSCIVDATATAEGTWWSSWSYGLVPSSTGLDSTITNACLARGRAAAAPSLTLCQASLSAVDAHMTVRVSHHGRWPHSPLPSQVSMVEDFLRVVICGTCVRLLLAPIAARLSVAIAPCVLRPSRGIVRLKNSISRVWCGVIR